MRAHLTRRAMRSLAMLRINHDAMFLDMFQGQPLHSPLPFRDFLGFKLQKAKMGIIFRNLGKNCPFMPPWQFLNNSEDILIVSLSRFYNFMQ